MGNDATGTVAMPTNAVQGGRPTTPWRGLIHTFVILGSLFPALALAPVYQWFAPVVLPAQWVAAAIGGHLMRVVYSLLATGGAFMTVAFAQWSFTRCANHVGGLGVALAVGIVAGATLFLSSRQGLKLPGFLQYCGVLLPVLAALGIGLLVYNPATNSFLSPGCPIP